MILDTERLSLGTLVRVFWRKILVTWGLTFLEIGLFAFVPLIIGISIDGLIADDYTGFFGLIAMLAVLLAVAIVRRIIDTRAYGTMRVELGRTFAARASGQPTTVVNARVDMGRELVDFLEVKVPEAITAFVQVVVSIGILLSFHSVLALSTLVAAGATILIYAVFAKRFFRINRDLNSQAEQQVRALESLEMAKISTHFLGLRRHEVRMSDTESVVYGLIFFVLLSMLSFNVWFSATQSGGTAGEIFSIVSYSFELIQATVMLPFVLQAWTRLHEITGRLNETPLGPRSDQRVGN
ncbi:MAG: ABC transporter six-transmembrane domain-containing protein [Pseudomonadota bacterium]